MTVRRIVSAAAVALLFATGLVAAQPAAAVVVVAPTPVVQGNKLVDSQTGATFVPRGVNIPGLEYSCVQGWRHLPDAGEFAAMASWKINTVRLPLNESCWLGLDGAPSGSTVTQYKADVKSWVDGAVAAGLAVILDLHWNAPAGYTASGQRAMPDERSAGFWTSVATTYSTNKSVMFELFNEPYSRTGFTLTWDCWKNGGCLAPVENDATGTLSGTKYTVTGMQTLVTAVRATGATQPLLLGGLNYSNDLTGWLANKPTDPLNQLVAAWHNYPGQGCSTTCWNSTVTTVAASVPVVTTEFGNTAETTSTAANNGGNYLVPFMTWADAHGIGYLPWAWWDVGAAEANGNGSDIYALYSGPSFTPKSPSGTKFYNHLAGLGGGNPPQTPALTAATLVKSPTSSTIYLVDGAATLVPIGAFSSASDAGLSTAFSTVPQSALSAYTIASAPLSNVLVCGSTTYVSADGKVWPITPALVSAMVKTTLDSTTCAALPKAATTISGALFLTPHGGGTIYSVTAAGSKRHVLTMESLALLSAPAAPALLHVGAYYLDTLSTGAAVLPPARMVKSSSSPNIYLVDNFTTLIPISSFSSAGDAGVNPSFLTVTSADLAGTTIAPAPLSNSISCAGVPYFAGDGKLWPISPALVAGLPSSALSASTCALLPKSSTTLSTALFTKSGSSASIYLINSSGQKQPVLTMASLGAVSAPDPGIYLTVGDHFLNQRPVGPELLTPGMLVKTAASAAIYLVNDSTTAIPIRTFGSISDMGLPTNFWTIAASSMSGMTVSGAPASNIVSCGGQTFLAAGGGLRQLAPSVTGALPATALSSQLCAMPPRSTITGNVFVKAYGNPSIYQLVAGQKRPIGSWGTFLSLSAGGPVVYYAVNDAWVATVPTGALIP